MRRDQRGTTAASAIKISQMFPQTPLLSVHMISQISKHISFLSVSLSLSNENLLQIQSHALKLREEVAPTLTDLCCRVPRTVPPSRYRRRYSPLSLRTLWRLRLCRSLHQRGFPPPPPHLRC